MCSKEQFKIVSLDCRPFKWIFFDELYKAVQNGAVAVMMENGAALTLDDLQKHRAEIVQQWHPETTI